MTKCVTLDVSRAAEWSDLLNHSTTCPLLNRRQAQLDPGADDGPAVRHHEVMRHERLPADDRAVEPTPDPSLAAMSSGHFEGAWSHLFQPNSHGLVGEVRKSQGEFAYPLYDVCQLRY